MAKSKNHTAHNQNKKAHRNKIQRPKTNKYHSLKGVDPKVRQLAKFGKDMDGMGTGWRWD
ncbi:60S ribosomal protein L29 [Cryptococcus amylolentus CBS 6273]|nr:60S ribosomal protein L29 [Cryptococcus amylolentus CBS 6273]